LFDLSVDLLRLIQPDFEIDCALARAKQYEVEWLSAFRSIVPDWANNALRLPYGIERENFG
jgi:hypothetical protein